MFTNQNLQEILNVEEVCFRLGLSPSTVYGLLRSGQLVGFRLGSWKIPLGSVYEFINKKCDKK